MCISDIYDNMINTKSINLIEDTLKAKLPTGTVITNNNDGSYLIHTIENITKEMFSEYDYFNESVKSLYDDNFIPTELLYNILSLGNNFYLLQFKKLSR